MHALYRDKTSRIIGQGQIAGKLFLLCLFMIPGCRSGDADDTNLLDTPQEEHAHGRIAGTVNSASGDPIEGVEVSAQVSLQQQGGWDLYLIRGRTIRSNRR